MCVYTYSVDLKLLVRYRGQISGHRIAGRENSSLRFFLCCQDSTNISTKRTMADNDFSQSSSSPIVGIKSRERVQQHGEVFTSPREVNAILDLVKHETERIDPRFLEPACGDGNFLVEILRRKLAVCRRYVAQQKNTQLEYEKNCILAVSRIYGIELQQTTS